MSTKNLNELISELEVLLLSNENEFEKRLFLLGRNRNRQEVDTIKSLIIESPGGLIKLKDMLRKYWCINDIYQRHLYSLKICRLFSLSQTKFRILLDELPQNMKTHL